MGRYKDSSKAGRSQIVPFIPGEPPKHRHARRLDANLDAADKLKAWCEAKGIELKISNEGHHWRFSKDGKIVEWWPSSAKLVRDKKWRKGTHVHDYKQAQERVAGHLLGGAPRRRKDTKR